MKSIKNLGLALLAVVLLVGCNKSSDKVRVPNVGKERTILMYAMANNDIEYLISDNVDDMLIGLKEVAQEDLLNCNLLVYYQGYSYGEDRSVPQLYKIDMDGGKPVRSLVKNFSKELSTNPKRVKEVVNYVFDKFPAKSQGLIFSSHADGWVPSGTPRLNTRWVGQDGGDFLNLLDLKEALSRFNNNPLDFILWDVCFMQSVEVAYEFRKLTKFSIGSATETPGLGGPYKALVPAFYGKYSSPKALAYDIADTYYSEYESGRVDEWSVHSGVSMGVVDSDKLESLKNVTFELLKDYKGNLLVRNVFYYDQSRHHYYYDMYRVIEKNFDEADLNRWNRQFDKEAMMYFSTTPYNYSVYISGIFSMKDAKGLAMYVPVNGFNDSQPILDYYKKLEWYKDVMHVLF